jgi:hypothetical protein
MGQVASVEQRPHDGLEEISRNEVDAQLERVCGSTLFRRSKRLQAFLHYICELTLKGESERINEYLLAIEVFGRPSSYSTNEDSTVRRQAHLLREKLEKYYETEGCEDPLRIAVPVGQYVPAFSRQTDQLRPGTPRDAKGFSRAQVAALLFVAAILLFFAGRVTGRRDPGPSLASAAAGIIPAPLTALWGPWLHDPNGAVVCFSSPLTAVIKHYPQPRIGTLVSPSLRVDGAEEELLRSSFDMPPGGYVYMTPSHSQIKKGEGLGAVLLARLFATAGAPFKTTESLQLSWNNFRNTNLILFGNSDTNSWLDPLLESYPYHLRTHKGANPRSIVISNPAPEEQSEYFTEYPSVWNKRRLDYALVSMLPGLDHDVKLLLVNGLNHYATQAAIEYLTTPGDVETLLAHLRGAAGQREGPWFFQLVLRVEVREGVPTRSTLAALRVVKARQDQPVSMSQAASEQSP